MKEKAVEFVRGAFVLSHRCGIQVCAVMAMTISSLFSWFRSEEKADRATQVLLAC